jgi:hypothetical protein
MGQATEYKNEIGKHFPGYSFHTENVFNETHYPLVVNEGIKVTVYDGNEEIYFYYQVLDGYDKREGTEYKYESATDSINKGALDFVSRMISIHDTEKQEKEERQQRNKQ